MTESVRRRIFDAFFTTKEITGTGLGLWISSEIITKHQGTVRVRSRAVAAIASAEANGSTESMRESVPQNNSSELSNATGEKAGSGTVFMLFFPFNGLTGQAGPEDA
jgi:signal transduction histidine kinase